MKKEHIAKNETVPPSLSVSGKERGNGQGKFLRSPPIRQAMKPLIRPLWAQAAGF